MYCSILWDLCRGSRKQLVVWVSIEASCTCLNKLPRKGPGKFIRDDGIQPRCQHFFSGCSRARDFSGRSDVPARYSLTATITTLSCTRLSGSDGSLLGFQVFSRGLGTGYSGRNGRRSTMATIGDDQGDHPWPQSSPGFATFPRFCK